MPSNPATSVTVRPQADGSATGSDAPISRALPVIRKPRKRRLLTSPRVIFSLVVLAVFILMAAFGPLIAPYDPSRTSSDFSQPPSAAHWLGTTQSGQDVWSQLLVGAQVTLLVAVLSAVVASIILGQPGMSERIGLVLSLIHI